MIRRRIRMSVCLPVTVDIFVETHDLDAPEWRIASVRSANCEATPRLIEESMSDEDAEHMAKLAAKARNE